MKKLLHILLPMLCCIIVNQSALANNKTYYGKVNASVASTGGGKVYVSTSSDLPSADQYGATSSAVNTAEGGSNSSSANVSFYLFAQPEQGMKFDHWEKDNATVSATSPYTVAATSTTEGSPTVHDLTAVFSKLEGVMVSTDQPGYGTVTINKADNKIGDAVTLTATPTKVPGYGCANLVVKFKGWYDDEGNLLSAEPKYSFTVEKVMSIKGVFENKSTVVSGGYYRVRSSFNRVMTVDGSYTISGTNNDLTGLLSWTLPTGYVAADFNGKVFNNDTDPMEVETMPSTIIQLKGTQNGDGLTEAIGYSQGTDTKTLTGRTFTVQHSSGMPSYYEILSGSYSLKHGNTNPSGGAIVMVGNQGQNAYQFMAVQPINENTVDDFWFGVHPEEAMEYDGGYWASMYASFPYKCYEPDGVEAYYVKECVVRDGVSYAQLVKIESGIVPPATPVLLKCRGFESSKQNRLIPLDPDAIEIAPIEGNILAGEYQLNKSANDPGHVAFDAASMRVLGLGSDGIVGFYSLEGTPELERNKVYLDLTKIPAPARNLPVRLEAAASGAGEGASAEPSVDGYFRIQSKACEAADGGYIQITGPFTACPDQEFSQAATEAGSVIYVKAYPETVNGKVCHRIVNLRSQGIELCGGIDTDYMAKFSEIVANTTGTASVFEELMWSMVRQGFTDGYTSVGRVALEAMITIVATRLEEDPAVEAGELEAFARRFATEVADKINLSFYLEGNETDGFRIFYDVPNLQCVSDWYLKDENKETFEKGMAAMRAYMTAKEGVGTGEYFDPAEIAEMQSWGYDITAKYTPGADGIIASSYEQIFADPDLLFNWLKLNMIKFMDPERCPKITLRGYYLPDIATELRKHQLSNMLIGYFPDIMPDRRYFITNGKGAGSDGILDFSNEQHADEMGDYSRWLLKPVTADDDAYLCFPAQAVDADGYYAAVYTDFPMKAENPGTTKFYVLQNETKTATVKGTEIAYYELDPFEADVVPARTPVLIEMTSSDHTTHRIVPDYELVWNLAELPAAPAAIPVSDNATTIQRVAPRNAQEPEFKGVLLDTPISPAGFALQWNMQYSETETPVHVLMTASNANTKSGCWFAKQAAGTLPANSAVLMKPTTGLESYKIKIPEPAEVTSVESIETGSSDREVIVFDLEGRRVLNPRPGTIYIIDGKKVLLK